MGYLWDVVWTSSGTAVHNAAKADDLDALRRCAAIWQVTPYGMYWIVFHKARKCLEWLVEARPDLVAEPTTCRWRPSETPLDVAVAREWYYGTEVLLKRQAPAADPLFDEAMKTENAEIVKLLLAHGRLPKTPMATVLALIHNSIERCELLESAKPNPNDSSRGRDQLVRLRDCAAVVQAHMRE
jgi:hypothetical protein